MNYTEYFNKYKNKKIDYDNVAGVQCVDLAKHYINKCYGLKPGAFGNAKEWWNNRHNIKLLVDNFEFIKIDNTRPYAKTKLKQGDIGVRNSGTYGHIFIIDSANSTNITYYDQNGTGNHDGITIRSKPYTNYYITGVLRYKGQQATINATGGLNGYITLNQQQPNITIPNGTTVTLIDNNAGAKLIKGVNYNMSIIIYKGVQYYVANQYITKNTAIINATGGLNGYTSITSKKKSITIPNGTTVTLIDNNAGAKTINKINYNMAIVKYNNKKYYVANKYLQ